ncbi:hypothetical protein GCM10022206_95040 [Streptomyces chiangmaiensis]
MRLESTDPANSLRHVEALAFEQELTVQGGQGELSSSEYHARIMSPPAVPGASRPSSASLSAVQSSAVNNLPVAVGGAEIKDYERGLTWIKPSFLWMMYRCGWGAKAGQETVLAVEINRDGFEWALRHACLSSYVPGVHPDRATWHRQLKRAPARVQWDTERDLHLQPLPYRSLPDRCG